MAKSVTITVRVDQETNRLLDVLAESTKRSKSFLAGAAISNYAAREMEIIAGIEAGMADRDSGRVIPHDDVMDNIDHVIGRWGQDKP